MKYKETEAKNNGILSYRYNVDAIRLDIRCNFNVDDDNLMCVQPLDVEMLKR